MLLTLFKGSRPFGPLTLKRSQRPGVKDRREGCTAPVSGECRLVGSDVYHISDSDAPLQISGNPRVNKHTSGS